MFAFVKRLVVAATLVVTTGILPATAQDFAIDEFRFGGVWAQPEWLDSGHREADQAAVNAEILFREFNWDYRDGAPDDFLHAWLSPRLHLGGTFNWDDDGTSYVYTGLTWQFDITDRAFAELGFSFGLNDGSEVTTPTRAGLGSAVTFRESFALGYRITDFTNVILQVEHLSHAELFDDRFNRGLSNASLKIGTKF